MDHVLMVLCLSVTTITGDMDMGQGLTSCVSLLFAGSRGGDGRGHHRAGRMILLEFGRDGRGARLGSLAESAER